MLPFENFSRDPDNAYFSEGIQDEILTRLAKIAELKVISRTSTQRFKSSPNNLREIAQQLTVAHFLEGSVQKAGDKVRVTVQLINAATEAHLWAETYDRQLNDIFAVESEIAKAVAETLRAKLTGSAEQVLASKPTQDPEAHQLYLKGRYFWNRRTEADIKNAARYFEQAIAKDPSYALAYAGVADCYGILPNYSNDAPKPSVDRAIGAARRALELDDALAEGHAALANALGTDYQLAEAEAEYKRAFALNPSYATAHQWYGETLQSLGRLDEAIAELRHAHDHDPLWLIINTILASVYYTAGRDEEAWQQLRRTLELDPNFGVAFWVRAQLNERKGDFEAAIDDYGKSLQAGTSSDQTHAVIACAYVRSGRRAEAEKILQAMLSDSQSRFVGSYGLAQIYATLGLRDESLRRLEIAYEERSIPIGGAGTGGPKIDNRFDSLRDHPRFQKLLARFMGEQHD